MRKNHMYRLFGRFIATVFLFFSLFSCAERSLEEEGVKLKHLELEPIKSALYSIKGEVVLVSDGDTFSFKLAANDPNLKNKSDTVIRIRSFGIDAPEMDQPYGKEAADFLSHSIMGRNDLIVYMTGEKTYGRFVGIPFFEGNDISYETLKAGYAWVYTNASKIKHYKSAEREAKSDKFGFWAEPEPIKPWHWRKMTDEEKEAYKKKYGYN